MKLFFILFVSQLYWSSPVAAQTNTSSVIRPVSPPSIYQYLNIFENIPEPTPKAIKSLKAKANGGSRGKLQQGVAYLKYGGLIRKYEIIKYEEALLKNPSAKISHRTSDSYFRKAKTHFASFASKSKKARVRY